MNPMHIVRLNLAHDAQRILAIEQAAYRIEAALIGFDDIPPLHDTLELLLESGEAFYGCMIDSVLAGFVSCEVNENTVIICRLGVHPDYFRRGAASSLLRYLEATAYPDLPRFIVSTGAKNLPARRLYEQFGFVVLNEYEIEPGLMMAFYEKWR